MPTYTVGSTITESSVIKTVRLSGGDGRFDRLTVDKTNNPPRVGEVSPQNSRAVNIHLRSTPFNNFCNQVNHGETVEFQAQSNNEIPSFSW